MKAPARTVRAHLPQSDLRCDTVTVLNMAARRRPGKRFADMNAVAGLEDDWNLHWTEGPGLNHFRHIIDTKTGKRRAMTQAELHKPVAEWTTTDVRRWRRQVGRRWIAPLTVAQRQKQANRRLVTITWELKSRTYGVQALANRFVAALNKVGGKWCVMTLVVMKDWAAKLTAFHIAGAGTALLAHGAPRPADLHLYSPQYIDAIWGNFK